MNRGVSVFVISAFAAISRTGLSTHDGARYLYVRNQPARSSDPLGLFLLSTVAASMPDISSNCDKTLGGLSRRGELYKVLFEYVFDVFSLRTKGFRYEELDGKTRIFAYRPYLQRYGMPVLWDCACEFKRTENAERLGQAIYRAGFWRGTVLWWDDYFRYPGEQRGARVHEYVHLLMQKADRDSNVPTSDRPSKQVRIWSGEGYRTTSSLNHAAAALAGWFFNGQATHLMGDDFDEVVLDPVK